MKYKSYYIRKIIKFKRDLTDTLPDNNKSEIYESVNEYYEELGKADVDIKVMVDDEQQNVDNYVKTEDLGDANLELKDLDVLKDIPKKVGGLENTVKEAREKIVYGTRPRETNYPNLNDEEMRMLSDEPIVVEKLEDFFVMENEVRFADYKGYISKQSLFRFC